MSANDRVWAARLPADLYDQLAERAKREERTLSGLMRLLARQYVESDSGTGEASNASTQSAA